MKAMIHKLHNHNKTSSIQRAPVIHFWSRRVACLLQLLTTLPAAPPWCIPRPWRPVCRAASRRTAELPPGPDPGGRPRLEAANAATRRRWCRCQRGSLGTASAVSGGSSLARPMRSRRAAGHR